MVQQLTNLEITRVSLVDKGANLRRLAVLKRDEEGPMAELAAPPADATAGGIAAWLRKAADAILGRKVEKTMTFAEIVAGQELNDALYDSWSTLQDALWQAIYAYDEAGQPLSMEAKQQLVAQNLDEYKAYLLAAMATDVGKSAGSPTEAPSRHIAAIVAKVGRKISGSRLERLQAAAEALTGVLAEVVEETTDSADAQEEEVEKSEIMAAVTEAVTKAQEPLVARIDALEKSGVAKGEADSSSEAEGDDAPVTLETIAEAVVSIADRVGKLEGPATGARTSIAGQDGGTEVKKRGVWAGSF